MYVPIYEILGDHIKNCYKYAECIMNSLWGNCQKRKKFKPVNLPCTDNLIWGNNTLELVSNSLCRMLIQYPYSVDGIWKPPIIRKI